MDELAFLCVTILIIAIVGTFLIGGMAYHDFIVHCKENKLIDKEFELYNDFMPSHWNDDWNGGDDL